MQQIIYFFKFINWYVLIITFILGLVFNTGLAGEPVKIFIYPTSDNKDILQVKDNSGTCFSFDTPEVNCKDNVINIPLQ